MKTLGDMYQRRMRGGKTLAEEIREASCGSPAPVYMHGDICPTCGATLLWTESEDYEGVELKCDGCCASVFRGDDYE